MRRVLTGLIGAFLVVAANTEAHALAFPLAPGDSLPISGAVMCAKWMPCEGGKTYEFQMIEPSDFEASLTLDNFTDVTFRLFPAESPGAPLHEWFANSPGGPTLVTLAYAGLVPGIEYNLTIFGSVPLSEGTLALGTFEGSLGVASATVSTVPLPGAFWLFGSGLLTLLVGFARRR